MLRKLIQALFDWLESFQLSPAVQCVDCGDEVAPTDLRYDARCWLCAAAEDK